MTSTEPLPAAKYIATSPLCTHQHATNVNAATYDGFILAQTFPPQKKGGYRVAGIGVASLLNARSHRVQIAAVCLPPRRECESKHRQTHPKRKTSRVRNE